MLIFVCVYTLYLCAGWLFLATFAKYTPNAMRREIALNGVGFSPSDSVANFILTLAYLFVLNVWPISLYRKMVHGRVVGE